MSLLIAHVQGRKGAKMIIWVNCSFLKGKLRSRNEPKNRAARFTWTKPHQREKKARDENWRTKQPEGTKQF